MLPKDKQHGKVLHIIDTGGPGGAETLFCQLIERTTTMGWQPIPLVTRDGWLSERLRAAELEPIIMEARGSMNAKYLAGVIRIIKAERPAVIHAHLIGSAVYAALAGLVTGTPTIGVIHGPSDIKAPGKLAFIKRRLLAHGCSQLVAVSSSTREALRMFGIPDGSIRLITNGVDTDQFSPGHGTTLRQELGIPAGGLLIGAVGNIRNAKAYDVLLKAAALVLQRVPEAHFVVVGHGDDDILAPLLRLRAELDIVGRFRFIGFLQSTAGLYGNFDVFVSSSSTEGLSLSFLEAMATASAVVATRSGGAQEALGAGECGLLVDVGNSGELAAAIVRMLSDHELRTKLGVAARMRVLRRFSLDGTVKEYEQLYRQLIKS